jgi:diguanylate cyclase (GGDEF)-like protein
MASDIINDLQPYVVNTPHTQDKPIAATEEAGVLDANILLAGMNVSDVTFMKTMLEISGFSKISTSYDYESLVLALRHGIVDDVCNIDLIVLSSDFKEQNVQELRLMMDQFDEWRLIPIISLTEESQWDHAQVLTDLGNGVTSFFYHPLTAESFPPAVMTALAVKKERDHTYQKQAELEEEVANLKVMEARLKFSVNHDDLTGLANRRRLEQALQTSLIQVRNFATTSALYYIDLDSFKVLNDSAGHEAGDALLVQVANSLRSYFSTNDTLVRIGSDEYAVLVDDVEKELELAQAEGLRALFDGYDFEYLGHHFHLSASIGICFIETDDRKNAGEILAQANQACYTAKKRGRNRVHLYNADDREMQSLRHNVQWAPRIRAALKQEDFIFEFQPIHSLKNMKTTHYECLIRMRGEDGVVYYPKDFIPVAEKMGLIHQIDFWVINHAFDILKTTKSDFSITINLSGNIFSDQRLLDLVKRKIKETEINPQRIVFEITETTAVSNFELAKAGVNKLRALGCRFALDDFGAGFSSYSYLKHFAVDMLKIDGSFVSNLVNDSVDQLLVKSMVEIAHNLEKTVVAEFVEDEQTQNLLRSYGVDYIQGYLIGRPQPALPNAKLMN